MAGQDHAAGALQALGFESHADYDVHQKLLAKVADAGESQAVLVTDGPWCVLQVRPAAGLGGGR